MQQDSNPAADRERHTLQPQSQCQTPHMTSRRSARSFAMDAYTAAESSAWLEGPMSASDTSRSSTGSSFSKTFSNQQQARLFRPSAMRVGGVGVHDTRDLKRRTVEFDDGFFSGGCALEIY
jgi:hypothetical protein